MNIVVVNRDSLDKIPPLISVIEILHRMGHNVHVITCGMPYSLMTRFSNQEIKYSIIYYTVTKNIPKKISNVLNYRKKVYLILKEQKPDIVWIEGGGTFRLLTDIKDKYRYVLQISELYEKNKKIHKALSKMIYDAKAVIMPEYNRATFFQVEFQLPERPIVLPNKPYFWLSNRQILDCEKKYSDSLQLFRTRKVILYQGIIHKERDLTKFIEAINELSDEYVMVLLGPDWGALEQYKRSEPRFYHIDYIPAPEYLIFTMYAYIGIVTYDSKNLNCAYCAPNKIYEYAKYALPMIGNDIPGLRYSIEKWKAGVLVSENSKEEIKNAILKIDSSYKFFSDNSKKMFDGTDNKAVIEEILDKITSK